eukprot:2568701-Pyramimonas_sp.AAC.1
MQKLASTVIAKQQSGRSADEETTYCCSQAGDIQYQADCVPDPRPARATREGRGASRHQEAKMSSLQEEIEEQLSEKAELELLIKSMKEERENNETIAASGGGHVPGGDGVVP